MTALQHPGKRSSKGPGLMVRVLLVLAPLSLLPIAATWWWMQDARAGAAERRAFTERTLESVREEGERSERALEDEVRKLLRSRAERTAQSLLSEIGGDIQRTASAITRLGDAVPLGDLIAEQDATKAKRLRDAIARTSLDLLGRLGLLEIRVVNPRGRIELTVAKSRKGADGRRTLMVGQKADQAIALAEHGWLAAAREAVANGLPGHIGFHAFDRELKNGSTPEREVTTLHFVSPVGPDAEDGWLLFVQDPNAWNTLAEGVRGDAHDAYISAPDGRPVLGTDTGRDVSSGRLVFDLSAFGGQITVLHWSIRDLASPLPSVDAAIAELREGTDRLAMDLRAKSESLATKETARLSLAFALQAGIGMLLLGSGFLAAFRVVRRVRRLNVATEAVLADRPVALERVTSCRDEIGDFARAFARMAEQLDQQKQRIQEHVATLEDRVAERTAELTERNASLYTVLAQSEEQRKELAVARGQAAAAATAKSNFIANVSHELRTPLHGVLGLCDMLLHNETDKGRQRTLERQRLAAERLLTLVQEMLDVADFESGNVTIESVVFEVEPLLRHAIALGEEDGSQPSERVHLEIDESLPARLLGDGGRISRVVAQLVNNAVRFGNDLPVQVRTTRQRERWLIEVQDRGVGIPEANLERIFELFSQGDESQTRRHGGTGLGLAVSRRLVMAMGGQLHVSSEVGVGSRFIVDLPCTPDPDAREERVQPQTLDLLLVEDNALNQRVAKSVLQRAGHRVSVASDGQEGFEAAREHRFDLILMDLQMPVLDGFGSVERIRAEGASQAAPILAVSANLRPEVVAQCKAVGMNGALDKPFRPQGLLDAIGSTLARSSESKP